MVFKHSAEYFILYTKALYSKILLNHMYHNIYHIIGTITNLTPRLPQEPLYYIWYCDRLKLCCNMYRGTYYLDD
jgi:hypothetical protein